MKKHFFVFLLVIVPLLITNLVLADLPADVYEEDDSYQNASWITTDGVPQYHTFNTTDFNDWIRFNTTQGYQYTIETSNHTFWQGEGNELTDTWIWLYDNTISYVTENDDIVSGVERNSRITFVADSTSFYYVNATIWGTPQENSSYFISVEKNLPVGNTKCHDGSGWVSCDTLEYADTISAIRTNCSSSSGIGSVSYVLTNIQDSQDLIDSDNYTYQQGVLYVYNSTDVLLNNSGYHSLSVTCQGSGINGTEEINWTVPWGSPEPYLVSPNVNIVVNRSQLFNITTGMFCRSGECQDIQAILDPKKKSEKERIIEDVKDEPVSKITSENVDGLEEEVNVIIRLKEPLNQGIFDDEKEKKTVEKELRLATQGVMIDHLKTANPDLKVLHQYKTVNSFSATVSRKQLKEILDDPAVDSVHYDEIKHITLDASIPFINADDVWDITIINNITGVGQVVCVLDTGIEYSHTYLGNCSQAEFLAGSCEKVIAGYDFINDDNDPMDDNSHGTHVAGIVGGTHPIYTGVAPDVRFVTTKVCDAAGSCPTSAIIAGMDWCIDNKDTYNITVLTMSVGGGGPYQAPCDSAAEAPYINLAYENGLFFSIAAGNDGWSNGISSPACVSKAISIGTVNEDDTIYYNRGYLLDLLAPGRYIYANILNDLMGSKSGTSMSTPHAAGVAVLLQQYNLEKYGRLLTVSELKTLMQEGGTKVYDSASGLTFSRIDVLNSINLKGAVSIIPGDTPFYTINSNPYNGSDYACLASLKKDEHCNQTWTLNATGNISTTWEFFTIYDTKYNYNTTPKFNITIVASIPPNITTKNLLSSVLEDDNFSFDLNVSDPELEYGDSVFWSINDSRMNLTQEGVLSWTPDNDDTGFNSFRVMVNDSSDLTTVFNFTLDVVGVNDPPTVDYLNLTPIGPKTDELLYGNVTCGDIDQYSNMTVYWYIYNDSKLRSEFSGQLNVSSNNNTQVIIINPGNTTKDQVWNITTYCNDGIVSTNNQSMTRTILNSPPEWDINIDDNTSLENFTTFTHVADLDALTSDADGDSLSYNVISANESLVNCSIEGTELNISTGGGYGETTCTVNVSDGTVQVSDDFTITVADINDAPTWDTPINNNYTALEDFVMHTWVADLDTLTNDYDNATLIYTVTDENASLVGCIVTGNQLNLSASANAYGITTCTINVSDGEYQATNNFTINVTNVNDAPTVASPIADNTSMEDFITFTYADLTNVFGDIDNTTLVYTITNENTSLVNCSISGDNLGLYSILDAEGVATCNVTASDGQYDVSDQFQIIVANVNDAPTWDVYVAGNITTEDFTTFTLISGLDGLTSDVDNESLVYSVIEANLSIVDCIVFGNVLNVSPVADANGVTNCTLIANDGEYTINHSFTITVAPDNDAPVITTTNPSEVASVNVTYNYDFDATDVDTGDTNLWRINYSNSTGAVINTLNGNFTWTPNAIHDGNTYTFVVVVNDTDGTEDFHTWTIFVSETINPAVWFEQGTLQNGTYNQGNLTVNVSASDNTGVDTITINILNASNYNTTTYSCQADNCYYNQVLDGEFYINASVNDTSGNTNWTSTRKYVIVDNAAPLVEYVTMTDPVDSSTILYCDYRFNDTTAGILNYSVYFYDEGNLAGGGAGTATYNTHQGASVIGGVFNSTHNISCVANATDGTGNFVSATDWVIIGSSNPTMNSSRISSSSNTALDDLYGYCNATDIDGDNMTYYYRWYLNNKLNSSGVTTFNNIEGDEVLVSTMPESNLSFNQKWKFSCAANDSEDMSTWLNSTEVTITFPTISGSNGTDSNGDYTVTATTNVNSTCRYSTSSESLGYYNMSLSLTSSDGLTHTISQSGKSDGDYHYHVRCKDAKGAVTNTSYHLKYTVSISTSSSGSSTSPSTTEESTLISEGKFYPKITKSEGVDWNLTNEDLPLSRLRVFLSRDVLGVNIGVVLKDTVQNMTGLKNSVYKIMELVHPSLSDDYINSAILTFRVDKEWYSKNNLNKSSTSLNKFKEGDWVEYSAILVDEDSEYYYFQSRLYSLSIFAITAEKNQAARVIEEINHEDSQITNIQDESVQKQDISSKPQVENPAATVLNVNYLEILFLVSILVVLYYLESKNEKDEKKK